MRDRTRQASSKPTLASTASAHEELLSLFASCPRGLEAVLAKELDTLGVTAPTIAGAGVAFSGDIRLAMRVNLHSRIASRVLMQVGHARYRDEDAIYRLARHTAWEEWINEYMSLRVDVSAQRSPLRSLNFVALRVKDAICDRFREASGLRPTVDTRQPDTRIFVFLTASEATLYLDLSGESLFKRGWRSDGDAKGLAPLKENLAAGLLALAGWQPEIALHDPYCGSGTLLIEAAQRALDIAPGIERHFAFERLARFDARLLADLRRDAHDQAARALERYRRDPGRLRLSGADVDPQAVRRARDNLQRAGIPEGCVKLAIADFGASSTKPAIASDPAPGLIVANPPYGERMRAHHDDDAPLASTRPAAGERSSRRHPRAETAQILPQPRQETPDEQDPAHVRSMQAAGQTLRRAFAGWRACLLSSDTELPRQLGMQPRRKTPLFNGAIECRLYCFEIFDRRES